MCIENDASKFWGHEAVPKTVKFWTLKFKVNCIDNLPQGQLSNAASLNLQTHKKRFWIWSSGLITKAMKFTTFDIEIEG